MFEKFLQTQDENEKHPKREDFLDVGEKKESFISRGPQKASRASVALLSALLSVGGMTNKASASESMLKNTKQSTSETIKDSGVRSESEDESKKTGFELKHPRLADVFSGNKQELLEKIDLELELFDTFSETLNHSLGEKLKTMSEEEIATWIGKIGEERLSHPFDFSGRMMDKMEDTNYFAGLNEEQKKNMIEKKIENLNKVGEFFSQAFMLYLSRLGTTLNHEIGHFESFEKYGYEDTTIHVSPSGSGYAVPEESPRDEIQKDRRKTFKEKAQWLKDSWKVYKDGWRERYYQAEEDGDSETKFLLTQEIEEKKRIQVDNYNKLASKIGFTEDEKESQHRGKMDIYAAGINKSTDIGDFLIDKLKNSDKNSDNQFLAMVALTMRSDGFLYAIRDDGSTVSTSSDGGMGDLGNYSQLSGVPIENIRAGLAIDFLFDTDLLPLIKTAFGKEGVEFPDASFKLVYELTGRGPVAGFKVSYKF